MNTEVKTYYKGTDANMKCKGLKYKMGVNEYTGSVKICESGIHCSPSIENCIEYGYYWRFFRVLAIPVEEQDDKIVTDKIDIVEEVFIGDKEWATFSEYTLRDIVNYAPDKWCGLACEQLLKRSGVGEDALRDIVKYAPDKWRGLACEQLLKRSHVSEYTLRDIVKYAPDKYKKLARIELNKRM